MKKIIFTFQEVGNKIDLDMLFINYGFKGIKVVKSYHYYVNSLDAFYNNDFSDILQVLKKQISSVKFNKVPVVLNLASDQIFVERLTLPILSASETTKTFKLELEKTYGDINNKFVIAPVSLKVDKYSNLFKVAFYKLDKYNYITNFIKKLGLSLNKVIIKPEAIKGILTKNNSLDLKKSVVVVNVGSRATDIVTFQNGKIDSFMIVNGGMYDVDNLIANAFDISLQEAEEMRLTDPDIEGIGKYSTIYDFFEEGLEAVIFRLKTIVGSYYENKMIDYILVNSEKDSDDYINKVLDRKLKIDIQTIKFTNQKFKKDLNLGACYGKTVNNKNFFF